MTTPVQQTQLQDALSTLFLGVTHGVRSLLTENLGKPLTPELAASIELAARKEQRTMREKIETLETAMRDLPQSDCPISHFFAPGVYLRKIDIKKGVTVTGAVHKTENLIVVTSGALSAATENGPIVVRAGDVLVCKPGVKNAVYALEDSSWCNVLSNPENLTDPDALVEALTFSKRDELLGGPSNKQTIGTKQREN